MNSLPNPGPGLRAWVVPPCISTRLRTMVNPIPRPPWLRLPERWNWVNRSNTWSTWLAVRPTPLSRMQTTTCSLTKLAVREISPPTSVYFAALLSKLVKTWVSRTVSALTIKGSAGNDTVKRCFASSSSGRLVSIAFRTTSASATGCLFNVTLPCVIRLTSSRSSTSLTICLTWRPIISTNGLCTAGSAERRSRWTALLMGASGLRSSWANVARNSSLRRSACLKASSVRALSIADLACSATSRTRLTSAADQTRGT